MKHWAFSFTNPPVASFKLRAVQEGLEVQELQRLSEKITTEWALEFSLVRDFDKEQVRDAIQYHMGDKKFWFDCGIDGYIREPQFLGYGDGNRRDWFLPWRWVYPQSVLMKVGGIVNSGWTLTFSTGALRFTTAPAADMPIVLMECKRIAKAFFVVNGNTIGQMTDNFKVYDVSQVVIREYLR